MDIVLEHGGEDLNDEGDSWEILTDPGSYEAVPRRSRRPGFLP
jgi:transcriptional/translational regulatory protein YebC/TACO1